ncbi:MAG: IS1 family transposase [Gammaproteobacteria bacterium]|nr:IS1 family transposase [Gammaproteobacteria bacterium]MYF31278.1 IS1 family transposase [Gammaproteobacteria bacterium]MYK47763.1 IS1 family transposase [Gammaproteobacteria bacterium]
MNTLPTHKKVLILKCLTEGMSVRATARIADVSRVTATKLLVDAAKVCADYQDRTLRDLKCNRIQVDEAWCFIYAKQKNVARAKSAPREAGDVWTWVAIDADTKLVPAWRVGDRSGMTAIDLMDDLRSRLRNRVQLTTDGHRAYLEAVEGAFGGDVDYAMLIKLYGATPGNSQPETRYSPGECIGIEKHRIEGNPDPRHVSTSYVERQNLTMRMSMRRFTRLTNAFSKKLENHAHAVALHYMVYNFCRIHQSLRVTPAMAAGVTDRLWEIGDIVRMVEEAAPKPGPRGPYKKRASNSN